MGAKSVGEIGINVPISNALCAPFTPERVLTALLNGSSLFHVGSLKADVYLQFYKEARKRLLHKLLLLKKQKLSPQRSRSTQRGGLSD
ncbi:hypothetical protein KAX17_05245, partial [Candidatus Bipolaricaulota bacterium]|nr:hypothetical protein [Candidatus Bipolaricaulota bacterium]